MFHSSIPELYWFLFGIGLFIAEIVIPGFILFFFGIGAWVTALLVYLGVAATMFTQLLTFLIASLFTLVVFRRYGKQYFWGTVSGKLGNGDSIDTIKGARVTVVRDIIPGRLEGKVEFHGTLWNAEGEMDVEIVKGTIVEIVDRQDLTLIVRPV